MASDREAKPLDLQLLLIKMATALEEANDDSIMLQALSYAGVDNWHGYPDALEEYHEMKDGA